MYIPGLGRCLGESWRKGILGGLSTALASLWSWHLCKSSNFKIKKGVIIVIMLKFIIWSTDRVKIKMVFFNLLLRYKWLTLKFIRPKKSEQPWIVQMVQLTKYNLNESDCVHEEVHLKLNRRVYFSWTSNRRSRRQLITAQWMQHMYAMYMYCKSGTHQRFMYSYWL